MEKWAEFTQRKTEMSVTDENFFFLIFFQTHSGATGLSKEQRGQDGSPSVLQTRKVLRDALASLASDLPESFFIFLTFSFIHFSSLTIY